MIKNLLKTKCLKIWLKILKEIKNLISATFMFFISAIILLELHVEGLICSLHRGFFISTALMIELSFKKVQILEFNIYMNLFKLILRSFFGFINRYGCWNFAKSKKNWSDSTKHYFPDSDDEETSTCWYRCRLRIKINFKNFFLSLLL